MRGSEKPGSKFQVLMYHQSGRQGDWYYIVHGTWLVIASQKVIHNVWDGKAKYVAPLRKEIKNILTRQGLQYIRGLSRK